MTVFHTYFILQASGLADMIASAGTLSEPTQNTIQTFAALDKRYVQVCLILHCIVYMQKCAYFYQCLLLIRRQ